MDFRKISEKFLLKKVPQNGQIFTHLCQDFQLADH